MATAAAPSNLILVAIIGYKNASLSLQDYYVTDVTDAILAVIFESFKKENDFADFSH